MRRVDVADAREDVRRNECSERLDGGRETRDGVAHDALVFKVEMHADIRAQKKGGRRSRRI